MEGVGARLGRSSTRYGPVTVFTGPVRKWKKKWVHPPPPSSENHHHTTANGAVNATNASSHLLLYKWIPITPTRNKHSRSYNHGGDNGSNGNAEARSSDPDDNVAAEEPPRRKFKYIPIIVLEEQNNESSEQIEDEPKPVDIDARIEEGASKSGDDEKPDINDVPLDENQAQEDNPVDRQDLNESTLDLSLRLKAQDGEDESKTETDKEEDQLE